MAEKIEMQQKSQRGLFTGASEKNQEGFTEARRMRPMAAPGRESEKERRSIMNIDRFYQHVKENHCGTTEKVLYGRGYANTAVVHYVQVIPKHLNSLNAGRRIIFKQGLFCSECGEIIGDQAEFLYQPIKFSTGGYMDGCWSGIILDVLENNTMTILIDSEHTAKTEEKPGWFTGLIAQDENGQWVMTREPDRLDCPPPPKITREQAVDIWRQGKYAGAHSVPGWPGRQ